MLACKSLSRILASTFSFIVLTNFFLSQCALVPVTIVRRRFRHGLGSNPICQKRSLLKGQLIRCLDSSTTFYGAVLSMVALCQEFICMGYNPLMLSCAWSALDRSYPYLKLIDYLPPFIPALSAS